MAHQWTLTLKLMLAGCLTLLLIISCDIRSQSSHDSQEVLGKPRNESRLWIEDVKHPLDPLPSAVCMTLQSVLREASLLGGDKQVLISVVLDDRLKDEVLASKPGTSISPQHAEVVMTINTKLRKIIVDVSGSGRIVENKEIPGSGYPALSEEAENATAYLPATYQPFLDSIAARGIAIDDVYCEAASPGWFNVSAEENRILVYLACYDTNGTANVYMRPLEGLTIVVDTTEMKIIRYLDLLKAPAMPTSEGTDYRFAAQKGLFLTFLKPVVIEHSSFTLDGHIVKWAGWEFHVRPNLIIIISLLAIDILAILLSSDWKRRVSAWFGILFKFLVSPRDLDRGPARTPIKKVREITTYSDCHETASLLTQLIAEDGAGSWPPRSNHDGAAWPAPLRPYQETYLELGPLLPSAKPSTDDEANRSRIADFRSKFREQLRSRVDLARVRGLLEAADAGRWDVFPRDTYNAFYCCVGISRHAYRWGVIPVVRVAQFERQVDLPAELVEPWERMQRHFGCTSQAGNQMSNHVLNFDPNGRRIYKINEGLDEVVLKSEEAFARIFHEVEVLGLPMYHDMVDAITAFARDDKATCAQHVSRIAQKLSPLLHAYYDRLHNKTIAHSAWLSNVQGFYAWGAGHPGKDGEPWVQYDGLSGNQALLFMALDAFLGIEPYLATRDAERNIPRRQRALCRSLEKHSFRARIHVNSEGTSDVDCRIQADFEQILKSLRTFRSAHRGRAKVYLSVPAPERQPMTAGKSLLKDNTKDSLAFLDEFMVRRLKQTV
ncbi:hypothetical protein KC19_5G167900 [Ceratodon purpureus]|uniref:Amine oxidase n=1 Tax=Ceratodon purpureus TaxID=3225 RepID=A0A8T0I2E3_CERPU|nr:hypothetical protein KC19_5G167900 [Ceratodon purpureus]